MTLDAYLRTVVEGAFREALPALRAIVREEIAAARSAETKSAESPEMSVAEVCELFGRDASTIWRWRSREVNPFPAPRRTGGNVSFLRTEVEAWRASLPRVELSQSA